MCDPVDKSEAPSPLPLRRCGPLQHPELRRVHRRRLGGLERLVQVHQQLRRGLPRATPQRGAAAQQLRAAGAGMLGAPVRRGPLKMPGGGEMMTGVQLVPSFGGRITPGRRRALRRQRASARRLLFLHRKGFLSISPRTIWNLRQKLALHHSRDPAHLRLLATMTSYQTALPWRCRRCVRVCGKSAQCCPQCGQPWEKCYDQSFVPPQPRKPQPQPAEDFWDLSWGEKPWDNEKKQKPKSPRRRPNTPKGDKRSQNPSNQPWPPQYPNAQPWPWPPPKPTAPPQEPSPWMPFQKAEVPTPAPVLPSASDLTLRQLLGALKKCDNLSPEVQNLMQTSEAQNLNAVTRDLHLVVNQIGTARRNLEESRMARARLHSSWKSFLETSITRWHGYIEAFARQDQQLQDETVAALASLKQARAILAESRDKATASAGPKSDADAQEISDDENMIQDKDSSAKQILADVKEVADSLINLKHKVDASWTVEEKAAKAVKLEPAADPKSAPSAPPAAAFGGSGPPSMSPFGAPALERASELACENGYGQPVGDAALFPSGSPRLLRPHRLPRVHRPLVRFRDEVEVHFDFEAERVKCGLTLPLDAFNRWHTKPWSLSSNPCESNGAAPVALSHGSGHRDFGTGSSPAAAPIQDMPEWIQHGFALLLDRNMIEMEEIGPIIYLRTWYVDHRHHGLCLRPRAVRWDAHYDTWLDELLEVWVDLLDASRPFEVLFVRPPVTNSPLEDGNSGDVILLQPGSAERAVALLCARLPDRGQHWYLRVAASLPRFVSQDDCLTLAGLRPRFRDSEVEFRSGGNLLPPVFQVLPAIGIDVSAPLPPREHEVDEVSWLAHVPARPDAQVGPGLPLPGVAEEPDDFHPFDDEDPSDPGSEPESLASLRPEDARLTLLWRLGLAPLPLRLDWTNFDDVFHQILQATHMDRLELVTFWCIQHTPADLLSAYTESVILQVRDEIPAGARHKYVLTDVEIHHPWPAAQPELDRRVRLLPHQVSRRATLAMFGLDHFCRHVRDRCLVWHNNMIVEMPDGRQHRALLNLRHGDYIRVALPPLADHCHLPPRLVAGALQAGIPEHQIWQWWRNGQIPAQPLPPIPNAVTHFERFDGPDHIDLMQRSAVRSSAVCSDEPASLPGSVDEPLPTIRAIHDMPQGVQDIHSSWRRSSCVRCDFEGPSATFRTWFIHHGLRQECIVPRSVTLLADYESWDSTIRDVWLDYVDPTLAVTLSLVAPAVPILDPDFVGDIIVEQGVDHEPARRAIVLSLVHHGALQVVASSVSTTMTGQAFLHLAQLPEHVHDRYQVNFGTAIIHLYDGFHVLWSGMSFVVVSSELFRSWQVESLPDAPDAEEVILLQRDRRPAVRVPLKLDDLVPSPQCARLPFAQPLFLRGHVPTVDLGPVMPIGSVVRWHESTLAVFDQMEEWNGQCPYGLSFFTDGSVTSQCGAAAAAVFMIVHAHEGDFLGGFRTVRLPPDATSPLAEHVAVSLALLWLSHFERYPGLHVNVGFDSTTAGYCAAGEFRPEANLEVARLNRALTQWLDTKLSRPIGWYHVRAHQGHPYNEAADAAAWAAAHQWIPSRDWTEIWDFVTLSGSMVAFFPWIWLAELAGQGHPSFPRLADGDLCVDVQAPFEVPLIRVLMTYHCSSKLCPRCLFATVMPWYEL
eukprot:Skav224801  [mRNA]  locus=scaffold764:659077:665030:- [translate_table: standard]